MLRGPFWLVAVAAVFLVGMWLYAQRVLVAYQITDAAAQGRPRGNLSDLYPRWVGARELLLHGRDPYSAEVTRDIQTGFYGRPLDPSRPTDPKDQQGFAYPVYVVFYLAPTVNLPFDLVRRYFFWFLLGLTVASIPIWLRVLHWPLALPAQLGIVALTLGSFAVMQGLKLEQITLLVTGLISVAIILLITNHPIGAGILLALATVKPQVVCGLLLWLAIWTIGDWKRRYRLAASFLLTIAVLFVASEIVLPHWLARFWQAAQAYRHYADAVPLLTQLIPRPWNLLPELGAGIAAALVCWKNRKAALDTVEFSITTCLMMAVTLLIVPSYALYNQVLLVPALLMIARERRTIWDKDWVSRVVLATVAISLIWPWLSSTVLAGLSFVVAPRTVQKAWAVPGWTALMLPVAVVALLLIVAHRGSSVPSKVHAPA